MDYVNTQLSSFFILMVTGMVLGGLFDIYRVWRGRIRVNWLNTAIGDLIFWCGALILAVPLIYWGTWLELRFYVWLAIGLGAVLYFGVFSALCIPVLLKFWQALTWLPRQVGCFGSRIGFWLRKLFGKRRNPKPKPLPERKTMP